MFDSGGFKHTLHSALLVATSLFPCAHRAEAGKGSTIKAFAHTHHDGLHTVALAFQEGWMLVGPAEMAKGGEEGRTEERTFEIACGGGCSMGKHV